MKACKDCKHLHLSWVDRLFIGYDFAQCKKFSKPYDYVYTSPISGKSKKRKGIAMPYCSRVRNNPLSCGPDGIHFEPKT